VPMDRTTYEDGTEAEDRSGPFDIEREDVVLARVVDATVPIQPQGSGRSPTAVDAPAVLPPSGGGWRLDVEQPEPASPAGVTAGAPYEGYPDAVEGPADRPARSAVTDGQEWAQSPAAGRRRRMPAFSMARRGFEPVEVEMYLVQQDDVLAAVTERADTAERQLAEALAQLATARERLAELQEQQRSEPPASIQALGDRVSQILQQTWDAAEELRAEAKSVADGARAEVDEAVRAAEADARARADDIVAEADRHRRVVLEELASRRAEHDAEVARLTAERASTMAELERLHAMLQRALGPQVSAPPAGPAPSAPAEPSLSSEPAPSAGPVPSAPAEPSLSSEPAPYTAPGSRPFSEPASGSYPASSEPASRSYPSSEPAPGSLPFDAPGGALGTEPSGMATPAGGDATGGDLPRAPGSGVAWHPPASSDQPGREEFD
jgi:chaperonin cofactor prefoldin